MGAPPRPPPAFLPASLATAGAVVDALSGLALAPFRFAIYLVSKRRWASALRAAIRAPRPPLAPPPPRPERPAAGAARTIFVSVGDVSAEEHALRLVRETNARRADLRWIGFGGARMRAEGVEVREDLVGLGLIGFAAVLAAVPGLVRVVRAFARSLRRDRPDLVVLLDYPGLHFLLARMARKAGVPVLYYIAPQVWGWAPWRVRRMRADLSRVLCILPFEPAWFEGKGVRATLVGHPIADLLAEVPAATAPDGGEKVVLLPGSRRREIRRNLPSEARVFRRLKETRPGLRGVVAHAKADDASLLAEIAGPGIEIAAGRFHDAIAGARLALAKSGTAILEVAHHEVPLVVLYRVRPPGASLAPWILCTPWFASLNLLAGRPIVPEFCFERDADEGAIAQAAAALLDEGRARTRAIEDLREVRSAFDAPGTAARAAAALVDELDRPSPRLPRRRNAARVALVLAALVGAVGLAEVGARLFDPFGASYLRETIRYRTECLRLVARLDHPEDLDGTLVEQIPGRRVEFRRFTAAFNAVGLRGPELAVPKPAGVHRTLFLGDSVVFGWGVDDEATFVRRLERDLAARAPSGVRHEVVNGGHPLFDTTQEAALLESKGWALAPDLVCLVYVVNDIDPTRKLFEAYLDGLRAATTIPATIRARRTLTSLVPALADLARFARASRAGGPTSPPPGWPDATPETREGWERSTRALVRIADACADRGVPFILFDHTLPAIGALPRFCASHGIAYEDLRFRPEETTREFRLSAADAHANARGHGVLLRRLEEALTRRDLPPGVWR